MPGLKITGICRLTRDAEVFKSKNASWVHIGLVAYRKRPRDGQQKEDFFDAELYQKDPEAGVEKTLIKGKLLFLENAELRADRFVGKDGRDKTKLKVLIYSFSIINEGEEKLIKEKPAPKTEPEFPEKPPF